MNKQKAFNLGFIFIALLGVIIAALYADMTNVFSWIGVGLIFVGAVMLTIDTLKIEDTLKVEE